MIRLLRQLSFEEKEQTKTDLDEENENLVDDNVHGLKGKHIYSY